MLWRPGPDPRPFHQRETFLAHQANERVCHQLAERREPRLLEYKLCVRGRVASFIGGISERQVAVEGGLVALGETLSEPLADHGIEKLPQVGDVDRQHLCDPHGDEGLERVVVERVVAVAQPRGERAEFHEMRLGIGTVAVEVLQDYGQVEEGLVAVEQVGLLGRTEFAGRNAFL